MSTASISVEELARSVSRMRSAQKEYFNPNTRTPEVLNRSRALEREIDKMVAEVLSMSDTTQLILF